MPAPRIAVLVGALSLVAGLGMLLGAGHHARAAANLLVGWNNIAYQGPGKPPSEALASIDGKYRSVYRWDPAAQKYDVFAPGMPGFAATLDQLQPGDVIWLDMEEEGTVAAAATGGQLSIAASTFMPESDLALYEKTFNELHPVGDDPESQRYYAPVILPNGVTITSMTAAYEATGGEVQVRLDYTPITNGTDATKVYKLVEVLSSAGSSPQAAQAFSHAVDNAANVYFLVVDLTGGPGTKLHGVTIAYTGG